MLLLLIALAQLHGGDEVYRVADRKGFIQAVGSDRTIVIEAGAEIIISFSNDDSPLETPSFPEDIIDYPETPNVSWTYCRDGLSLVIYDVENLTIIGEGDRVPSLLAQPRYGFVLVLRDCSTIQLENIILGHTDYGYCENGVLGVENSTGISVEDCLLFGCGTEGLTIRNSSEFRFINSEISDCTGGIMSCFNSDGLSFENSIFRNNREYYGVDLYDCRSVIFRNCIFRNNYCDNSDGFFNNASMSTSPGSIVKLETCVFDGIACPKLYNSPDRFDVRDCLSMRIRSCDEEADFYRFKHFNPEDMIIEAVCPSGSALPFYENLEDFIPYDSIRREEPYGSFRVPVWMTGHISDEFGLLLLCSIGTRQMDNGIYRYEVIIDDVLGRTMWLNADEELIRIMSWPEFLCECFLSQINNTDNPMREEPEDAAAVIVLENIAGALLIEPNGVDWRGEWLLVESLNTPWAPVARGWVRWTDGDSLLIDYYLMY
ncbi:MAG: hypothetical protein GQ565_12005 [Candidatus Aegiribacteria sp.]|nr:hypothetical protein [Candidatus Aegiribacteria sp.]